MWFFLVSLLLGFALSIASAFTTAYSRRWGDRAGTRLTFVLRVVLGMPLWILGLALAMRARTATLIAASPSLEALGGLVLAAGTLPMILGLLSLGVVAALPSTGDSLVERGVYAHVRHPIYSGMLLEFVGMPMLRPSTEVLLACLLGLAWVFVQTRAEERDLLQRVPIYRDYMKRVPPYFPRIRPRH